MNGIIVVDKEVNYTSRDIVNIISKELKTKKVGHTGTLDPMASGVLVVCVGNALKVVELITNHDKEYIAKVRLGYETDTLDSEGTVVKSSDNNKEITNEIVNNVLEKFSGKIKQEVPIYSAVKVNGKKLYEYARNNIEVELPIRDVYIYDIELVNDVRLVNNYYEFSIKCHVSKGTYIRSLVRDIGISLGTYATMIELRRTKQGNISIEDANKIEDIKNNKYKLISIDNVLDIKKIVLSDELIKKVRNGCKLNYNINYDKVMIVDKNNNLVAIYEKVNDKLIKPWKVFN